MPERGMLPRRGCHIVIACSRMRGAGLDGFGLESEGIENRSDLQTRITAANDQHRRRDRGQNATASL